MSPNISFQLCFYPLFNGGCYLNAVPGMMPAVRVAFFFVDFRVMLDGFARPNTVNAASEYRPVPLVMLTPDQVAGKIVDDQIQILVEAGASGSMIASARPAMVDRVKRALFGPVVLPVGVPVSPTPPASFLT
jgi:hypothetical protein